MLHPEFMRIPITCIPQDIITQYNLMEKVQNGYIYVKIKKGMYGLCQAGVLAYNKTLWIPPYPSHCGNVETYHLQTKFCLCIDDFGINYIC